MLEHQQLINWLFIAFGAAIGWVLKVIWDAIGRLKDDMKQIERDLPTVYVRKDDFRQAVADIKEDMKELRIDMKDGFNKMDTTLGLLFKKIESKENKQ
jgi:F0F1-type ATP synthase membrane subunit b/b'